MKTILGKYCYAVCSDEKKNTWHIYHNTGAFFGHVSSPQDEAEVKRAVAFSDLGSRKNPHNPALQQSN
jgi:hypothetical protein